MEVRVLDERLRLWGLPAYQSAGAAAIDLYACIPAETGIAAQAPARLIPSGIALHFGDLALAALVLPRSGLGHRKGLVLGNGTGLIDPDYTGEILVSVWNRNPPGSPPIPISPGERIAQMVFVPVLRPEFQVVEEFSGRTGRASGGFGSTGA